MNEANNTTVKDYTVKEQKGVNTTKATIGRFDPKGINVDPQATPASAYTAQAQPYAGGNKATIGTIPQSFVGECHSIDPASTSPKKYTVTTK